MPPAFHVILWKDAIQRRNGISYNPVFELVSSEAIKTDVILLGMRPTSAGTIQAKGVDELLYGCTVATSKKQCLTPQMKHALATSRENVVHGINDKHSTAIKVWQLQQG